VTLHASEEVWKTKRQKTNNCGKKNLHVHPPKPRTCSPQQLEEVLTMAELKQVLLAIYESQRPGGSDLSNVPRVEETFSVCNK
jgi:hypothetical protein